MEERRLESVLEARDGEQMLRMCREVQENATLAVAGYTGNTLEQPVVHHVACLIEKVDCLRALIERLGSDCLRCRNQLGNTAVHCAALCQDDAWLQVIRAALGDTSCFAERGQFHRTAVHFAAQNPRSNAALRWLARECGPHCLSSTDEFGDTPVHLAAECQDSDSMVLIKRHLGISCFSQRGQWQRTAVHMAAMNAVSNDALKWLVNECGANCLAVPDSDGSTPVHLAAWRQTVDSLEFVANQLGVHAFKVKGFNGWTAVHYAAQNVSSNSALAWCVRELGPACLLDRDSEDATPAHLAAQCQDGSSLRLIADSLGVWAFSLADKNGKSVADCASLNHRSAGTLELISAQRPLLSGSFDGWNQDDRKLAIGEGRFSEVFKVCTDKNQTVAVKIIELKAFSDDRKLRKVIRRERRAFALLQAIQHPNIVQFLKCHRSSSGELCIFTELIAGQSLSDRINRQQKSFDEGDVRRFSRQICTALNFLHSRELPILHRDLNCDNIMVTAEGVIKLIDFGIAKEIVIAAKTEELLAEHLFGSCYFMAPELFGESPRAAYSPKTDVWALGCTVYQMVNMRPPNSHLRYAEIQQAVTDQDMPELPGSPDQVPGSLQEFYRRCVAREPEMRPDARELLELRFLSEFLVTAKETSMLLTAQVQSCVCQIL